MSELWGVIVHGGCKPVKAAAVAANLAGLEAAVRAAGERLQAGGSAVEAAEAAVRVLEDDPTFNAGTGSVANADGVVEVDASLMEGDQLNIGAVCALQKVRNPISVARAMLTEEHVLLAGEGAQRFAVEEGVRLEDVRPRGADTGGGDGGGDTVGCVVLDRQGLIAAATSTGGLTDKHPGRVGDSPLPGCGFWADNRSGGVSVTGIGERIARVALAMRAIQALEAGQDPQAAVEGALKALERVGGEAGLIALDRQGRIGWSFNATQMAVGWMTSADPEPQVHVAGREGDTGGGYARLR
jgi:beta-aspartyl-peptidase (threonine type)